MHEKAADENYFTYSPLSPAPESSFRVVTLLPGEECAPVACLLSHDDWKKPKQPFEAVSYCWGDRNPRKTIYINDQPFDVAPNLESALRHLRRQGRTRSQYRHLWVDAISINQSDIEERNKQVLQMYNIYNTARQVLVWLGDGNSDSRKAIDFMNQQLASRLQSVGFSCIDEQANVNSQFWAQWDEGKDSQTLDAIDDFINPQHARSWCALAGLLQRPWWTRAWAVQELISARKVTVQCGRSSLPWPLLDMTIQLMLRNSSLEALFGKRQQVSYSNAIEDAFAFAYERSHRILDGTGPLDFIMLMQITRYRKCQDSRDKVYSILSLLEPDLKKCFRPDYLQPLHVVYTDATRAHIQSTSNLHILSSCCMSQSGGRPNLPTWVPNWEQPFEMSYLGGYSAKEAEFAYCASGTSLAVTQFSANMRELTVTGVCIDSIQESHFPEASIDFDYRVASIAKAPWCSWNIHKVVDRLKLPKAAPVVLRHSESVLEAVLKTLIVDRDPINGKRNQTLEMAKMGSRLWPTYLEDYFAHVRLWNEGRKLVVSTNGYIGLAPSTTLPDDKICVLLGCHAPVILRPQPNKRYLLVGDAYIHGLMDGEALSEPSTMKRGVQRFVLR